jgi:hypothetical protein
MSNILCPWVLSGMRFQMACSLQNDVQVLNDMHWQTDCARLIHDAAFDVLAYPPSSIGRKPEATLGIEFFQRVHHSHIPFFNQVQ